MLEECGLDYAAHPINIGKDEQFAPAVLKISPNNRIPATVDNDAEGAPFGFRVRRDPDLSCREDREVSGAQRRTMRQDAGVVDVANGRHRTDVWPALSFYERAGGYSLRH